MVMVMLTGKWCTVPVVGRHARSAYTLYCGGLPCLGRLLIAIIDAIPVYQQGRKWQWKWQWQWQYTSRGGSGSGSGSDSIPAGEEVEVEVAMAMAVAVDS